MSDEPAAFRATYSDWKLIRSRGVVQIVLEIHTEFSDEAYRVLGGMPNPGGAVWVAVARLEDDEKPQEPKQKSEADRKAVQRAGIISNDEEFWRFLREEMNVPRGYVFDPERAASFIRNFCNVESRADLTADNEKWRDLDAQFKAWKREMEMTA